MLIRLQRARVSASFHSSAHCTTFSRIALLRSTRTQLLHQQPLLMNEPCTRELSSYSSIISAMQKAPSNVNATVTPHKKPFNAQKKYAVPISGELLKARHRRTAILEFLKKAEEGVSLDILGPEGAALLQRLTLSPRNDDIEFTDKIFEVIKPWMKTSQHKAVKTGFESLVTIYSQLTREKTRVNLVPCLDEWLTSSIMTNSLHMEHKEYLWRIALSALEKYNMTDRVEDYFLRLQGPPYNFVHDERTYDILIATLCRDRRLKKALQYFEEMKTHHLPRNHSMYLSLLTACARSGELQLMMRLFEDMEKAGIPGDTNSYNALLAGFASTGKVEEVLSIFTKMQTKGVHQDSHTYSEVIYAVGLFDCKRALEFYVKMRLNITRHHIRPFNSTLHVLALAGNAKKAQEILLDMHQLRIVPNHLSYRFLLYGYNRNPDFCELFPIMEKMMNHKSYNT